MGEGLGGVGVMLEACNVLQHKGREQGEGDPYCNIQDSGFFCMATRTTLLGNGICNEVLATTNTTHISKGQRGVSISPRGSSFKSTKGTQSGQPTPPWPTLGCLGVGGVGGGLVMPKVLGWLVF